MEVQILLVWKRVILLIFTHDIYDDKIYMAKIKYVIEPIYYLGVKNNSYINKHLAEDYIIKNKIIQFRH